MFYLYMNAKHYSVGSPKSQKTKQTKNTIPPAPGVCRWEPELSEIQSIQTAKETQVTNFAVSPIYEGLELVKEVRLICIYATVAKDQQEIRVDDTKILTLKSKSGDSKYISYCQQIP